MLGWTELQSWFEQTHQNRPGWEEAYSWTGSSGCCSHCLHPCLEGHKYTWISNGSADIMEHCRTSNPRLIINTHSTLSILCMWTAIQSGKVLDRVYIVYLDQQAGKPKWPGTRALQQWWRAKWLGLHLACCLQQQGSLGQDLWGCPPLPRSGPMMKNKINCRDKVLPWSWENESHEHQNKSFCRKAEERLGYNSIELHEKREIKKCAYNITARAWKKRVS